MKQNALPRSSALPVSVTDLSVRVGSREVLRDLTLAVTPGSVLAVTGRNGSGKSTLMRCLAGLLRFDRGTVRIFGSEPRDARRRVAYLQQSQVAPRVYPARVRDVVAMGCFPALGPFRRPGPAERAVFEAAIERMGLTELASRPIQELSAGEFQRTLVARTIAQQAGLLLLDEPFDGVDAESTAIIRDELWSIAAAGATVLVVDHDLETVDQHYDRVIRLEDGRVEESG